MWKGTNEISQKKPKKKRNVITCYEELRRLLPHGRKMYQNTKDNYLIKHVFNRWVDLHLFLELKQMKLPLLNKKNEKDYLSKINNKAENYAIITRY